MQFSILGYIDGTNLVRISLSCSIAGKSIEPDAFLITDEDDLPVTSSVLRPKPRNFYVTGEFFAWKVNPAGKMRWHNENQYYFCELPLSMVAGKEFKFIENNYIWYPDTANLSVMDASLPHSASGCIIKEKSVRFILQYNTFGFNNIELELKTQSPLKPDKTYFLSFASQYKTQLINRNIFDQSDFYYAKNDLGCHWSKNMSTFRIWSPVADELYVLLFRSPQSPGPEYSFPLLRSEKGVWKAEVSGNWENWFYLYRITINENTWQQIDPYSRALAVNSTHSLIFDPAKSLPSGWKDQLLPVLNSPTDAVIYELHIRDFSISPSWHGPDDCRGKFCGLCWSGEFTSENNSFTSGLDHLQELGVNVIQLLPVFDFNTVDETAANPNKLRNWGYDPFAYNVPEGSYAVQPGSVMRLREFRQMIMHLHNRGFKIVMDVVYNHTANVGAPHSVFDTFMPEYFYRMDSAGHYTNGSGCGNEIASEKRMVRKYILDSLLYWTKEYKIDGFRFDLMGLMDLKTMLKIVKELRRIKPDILIYGEPWAGGASPLKKPAVKGSQKNKGFAVFNDDFRNSLRGDTDGTLKGWVMGDLSLKDSVIKGIMGSLQFFTAQPSESINYISAHDNYTWFDKLKRTLPDATDETLLKIARLGLALVITAQGIPFLASGCEFLRTKRTPSASEEEIRNSYRASDEINQLDWSRKAQFYDFFLYLKRLIEIRHKYPAFRLSSALEIYERISIITDNRHPEIIAYRISGKNKETDLLVFHNPLNQTLTLQLPPGIWKIIFDDDFQLRSAQATHLDSAISLNSVSTTILELD